MKRFILFCLASAFSLMPSFTFDTILTQVIINPSARTVTTPDVFVDWSNTTPVYNGTNPADPEEVDVVRWSSIPSPVPPGPSGPNLTNTSTSSISCQSGNVEYSGNSRTPRDP